MTSPILESAPLGFPWPTIDPFLFCVHHLDAYPAGNAAMGPSVSLSGRNLGQDFEVKDGFRMYHGHTVPGFPQHPHRGFETVTIMRQGFVDHSDSLGAVARFGPGDVQWLTAGRGIVHCEMFPLLDERGPNTLELFQIWLNLPSRNKMVAPHFSMLWNRSIPRRSFIDANGIATEVSVIAGQLGDVRAPSPPPDSWAAQANADVAIWSIKIPAGGKWTLPKSSSNATIRMIYFFKGDTLHVGSHAERSHRAMRIVTDRDIELTAEGQDADVLLLAGKPIGETVAQYGPFVMNTREEIQQAILDYQKTQFGGWPYESDAPVHPRKTGRFARHADGRTEAVNDPE